jgi:hypothetical protein
MTPQTHNNLRSCTLTNGRGHARSRTHHTSHLMPLISACEGKAIHTSMWMSDFSETAAFYSFHTRVTHVRMRRGRRWGPQTGLHSCRCPAHIALESFPHPVTIHRGNNRDSGQRAVRGSAQHSHGDSNTYPRLPRRTSHPYSTPTHRDEQTIIRLRFRA